MKIMPYLNGLLTGVIIGVLFAPRRGYETRRRLAMGFSDLKRSVNNAYEVSKEEISNELGELKDEEKAIAQERVLDIKDDITHTKT